MIDLHVHTWRCRHATGTVWDMVEAGAMLGLTAIGFAEHLPLPDELVAADPHAVSYAMPVEELPDYVREVLAASAASEIEVLLGIEVDLHAGNGSHVAHLLSQHPFDYVLGSIHYVDGWAFDDPDRIDVYSSWTIDDLWQRYFDDLSRAARSGLVDVIAHPDLIKKFGMRPAGDVRSSYAAFADAVREAGIAVEVNTAGLRKPCAEIYPGEELLAMLFARRVPVTIGSDAHAPRDVAYGYAEAIDLLKRTGYRSVLTYKDRQPREVPL